MFEILFFVLVLTYCGVIFYCTIVWDNIPIQESQVGFGQSNFLVSIIVAVRNEEENIGTLLNCLTKQNIANESYEVIIVDDHSEDRTVEIVKEFLNKYANIKLLTLGSYIGSPKKNAIDLAVGQAKGQIIITTDGDCTMTADWIKSIISNFNNSKTKLVMGPVKYHKGSLFADLQWVDFSALQGLTAVSAALGKPLMGNGANLAFVKSAFYEVGKYDKHIHLASGDDEFLVKSFFSAYGPNSIVYLKNVSAIVSTSAAKSWTDFYNQKVRWASKWRFHSDIGSLALPIVIFMFYLTVIFALFATFWGLVSGEAVICLLVLKLLVNCVFVNRISAFYANKHKISTMFVAEVVYPFYAVIIGIASVFGNFQWKNRSFV